MLFYCRIYKWSSILNIYILVDIRLHEPLWRNNRSVEEIAVEIMTLSAQLEGICKECYTVGTIFEIRPETS